MAGPGIHNAQSVATGSEVKSHWVNGRFTRVQEVNGHQVPHGAGHLVHEAAGLSEKYILPILPCHGDFRSGELPLKEEAVEDGTQEHLEGSGGGQARARQHRGGDIGIKPGYRATQLDKTGGNAPDESGGGVDLPGVWLQPVQIHCAQGISCRLYTNLARSIGPNGSHGIQVDGSGQDTASLVVGMVAANFRSPGSGEKPVRPGGKGCLEARDQLCPAGRG